MRFEELQAVEADAQAFVAGLADFSANANPIRLNDGTLVPRLPGFCRWMWDGEFAGSVSLRWDPKRPELPPWCFGHIGYSVVPWKRRRGYATAAVASMLLEARNVGLPYVYVTTSPENHASQRVIVANGGALVNRFDMTAVHSTGMGLRYRIALD